MMNQIHNCVVILRGHLNCKVLHRILGIWEQCQRLTDVTISIFNKRLIQFKTCITEILLRKPGRDEGHLKRVGEGVKSVEGLGIHGAHNRKGSGIFCHSSELKNEYFYTTILLSTAAFITLSVKWDKNIYQ